MSYLSTLKLYHINRHFSLESFDNLLMTFIIKRRRKLFSSIKRNCLPITKDIFQKITKNKPLSVTDLNINTCFQSSMGRLYEDE